MILADKSHPYWDVQTLLRNEPAIEALCFSYYLYRPQTLADQRKLVTVKRADFLDASNFEKILLDCPLDQEVAFHSLVDCHDGTKRHLPMVDMATEKLRDLSKVNAFLKDNDFHGFIWFESGRSFHGYGQNLITHQQWIELMGKLLLCNARDSIPVVDPRWIGHRVIGGYAALRWTKNTQQYLIAPHKLHPQP